VQRVAGVALGLAGGVFADDGGRHQQGLFDLRLKDELRIFDSGVLHQVLPVGVVVHHDRHRLKQWGQALIPGNDLVAATALAASGAHIVLFTTGRGTPFASPVPTVKISSNSTLAGKKKNWIDFNAGVLVEDAELEETGQKLFDYVIDVASGKKVRSEEAGFHDMAIFKQGVTL